MILYTNAFIFVTIHSSCLLLVHPALQQFTIVIYCNYSGTWVSIMTIYFITFYEYSGIYLS